MFTKCGGQSANVGDGYSRVAYSPVKTKLSKIVETFVDHHVKKYALI